MKLFLIRAVILWVWAGAALAEYPDKPVRLLLTFSGGGQADLLARLVSERMKDTLGQPIVVEPRPGAGGKLAVTAVSSAAPDGHTLLFATPTYTLNTAMKVASYDLREFVPVANIGLISYALVTHSSVPATSVAELVAHARQNPGKLNFGSAGTGGVGNLSGEMFKLMAGIAMTHVPYKGAGPALADLIAGHIQATFETLGTALPPIKAGLVRPLGVTAPGRISDLPDLPTIAESGYPDYRATVWYGAAAPAGVSVQIADTIRASFNRALDDEVFRASLTKVGFPPQRSRSQAEIDQFVAADRARWAAVIKALNISLD